MNTHELIHSSLSNEWYTPTKYADAARLVMGGIDLDPASCEQANQVIKAAQFFDIEQNGLSQKWTGKVFLNPPYGKTSGKSNQEIWTRYLLRQFQQGITEQAILLVNATTDRKWFLPLWDFPICFTDHRIKFYNTSGTPNQPTHGNCFVYMGENNGKFPEIFGQFGIIAKKISQIENRTKY